MPRVDVSGERRKISEISGINSIVDAASLYTAIPVLGKSVLFSTSYVSVFVLNYVKNIDMQ
jgi:hypothetical protein